MIAGTLVPLLMYADDVVMLAGSQRELHAMMAVATEFARKNRFQFNGKKSGVMVFNAPTAVRATAVAAKWELFGEAVKVTDEYTYLGTVACTDDADWNRHVREVIKRAEQRSDDLLWMCHYDRGMRPRTAITLWQSLVRPVLEYASEIWSGQISQSLVDAAEAVQTRFIRGTLGLHANGSGVSNEMLRAEVGCERIQDRWTKLKLGYWRRVFSAPPTRLLRVVATFRHRERVAGAGGLGSRGWMRTAETAFARCGMQDQWQDTGACTTMDVDAWKTKVCDAVDSHSDNCRITRMNTMSAASDYLGIKDWGRNTEPYSFSSGEIDRIGQHVPERYLDDRTNLKGTRLKALCRLACLPVMDRVGREARTHGKACPWPKAERVCFACGTNQVEDVKHFVLACPLYTGPRARLLNRIASVLLKSTGQLAADAFNNLDDQSKLHVVLGKRIGDAATEDFIDRAVKKFLAKCWTARQGITDTIHTIMETNYGVYKQLK